MTRRGGRAARVLPWALALSLLPGVASAHEVSTARFQAPLPLSLLFAGAGAAVALTALWLAVTDTLPSRTNARTTGATKRTVARIDARTVRVLATVAAATFAIAVASALLVGVAGRQVAAENFATVFTWPVWFRGLALVAILVGSPWPVLSPWRWLYRGLCRLEGDRIAVLGEYPERLGTWPALLGFALLLGVIENLTVIPRSPRLTAVVVAAYAIAMVGGAVLFGTTWFDRADPLGVLYRLFGRVASVSIDRRADGGATVSFRPPWAGSRSPVAGLVAVAFVVAAVYTISFDGFTETRVYQSVLFEVRDLLGTGLPTGILLYVVGLALFVCVFLATVRIGDALGATAAAERGVAADGGQAAGQGSDRETPAGWRAATRAFAPTVLPIAAAYDVAHNYPFVLASVGDLVALVAGSLGVATGSLDPLAWLSVPAFWGSQVLLLVVGHVVAVVAAHRVATGRYPTPSAARRAHLPLVVLMVGYTVLSLWIVSQPVVQ